MLIQCLGHWFIAAEQLQFWYILPSDSSQLINIIFYFYSSCSIWCILLHTVTLVCLCLLHVFSTPILQHLPFSLRSGSSDIFSTEQFSPEPSNAATLSNLILPCLPLNLSISFWSSTKGGSWTNPLWLTRPQGGMLEFVRNILGLARVPPLFRPNRIVIDG